MRLSRSRHQHVLLRTAFVLPLLLLLSSLPALIGRSAPMPITAQEQKEQGGVLPSGKVFVETGKNVGGRFLEYWERNGALTRHGYPITDEIEERSDTDGKVYTVQYFERSVFELHPGNQPPYDVLLQLLGVFRSNELYPSLGGGGGTQKPNSEPGAQKFPQTGRTVGGKFLEYWNKSGGLPQFGYPISNEFEERNPLNGKPYLVQYFERAVFELHTENQPPYDVLLSQLGLFRWQMKQEMQKIPEFRPEIHDGQYVPLYPGPVLKHVNEISSIGYRYVTVQYEAPADADKVNAFYNGVMPKQGWSFLYSTDTYPYTKHYSWTDPKGVVPWHLWLSMDATGYIGSGLSQVTLSYLRYPDDSADKIPMYPHALEIKVSDGGEDITRYCTYTVTTTTYLTDDAPAEIESFYKNALPPHGWNPPSASARIDSLDGLRYVSDHQIRFARRGRDAVSTNKKLDLTVTAHTEASGRTRVTVILRRCETE